MVEGADLEVKWLSAVSDLTLTSEAPFNGVELQRVLKWQSR